MTLRRRIFVIWMFRKRMTGETTFTTVCSTRRADAAFHRAACWIDQRGQLTCLMRTRLTAFWHEASLPVPKARSGEQLADTSKHTVIAEITQKAAKARQSKRCLCATTISSRNRSGEQAARPFAMIRQTVLVNISPLYLLPCAMFADQDLVTLPAKSCSLSPKRSADMPAPWARAT